MNSEDRELNPGGDVFGIVSRAFGAPASELRSLSPLTLAFVGDAVWSLIASTVIVNRGNAGVSRLHAGTTAYVSAPAQSRIAVFLQQEGILSEEEQYVLRRGINAKPKSTAKNASHNQYHRATGLEALAGYLYIQGRMERLVELFRLGADHLDSEKTL